MNDIRRTILWVIFGFSMVLLWDKWQLHNGNKATFFPSPAPHDGACCPLQPARHRRWGAASVPASTTACRYARIGAAPCPEARRQRRPPRVKKSRSPPTCTA
jgi:YidC/Oxa1 family membrane protein insertase